MKSSSPVSVTCLITTWLLPNKSAARFMNSTPLTKGVIPNAAPSSSPFLACIVSKSMLAFMVAHVSRLASALASASSFIDSVSSVNMSSYLSGSVSAKRRALASSARFTSATLALTARILASAAINRSVFPICPGPNGAGCRLLLTNRPPDRVLSQSRSSEVQHAESTWSETGPKSSSSSRPPMMIPALPSSLSCLRTNRVFRTIPSFPVDTMPLTMDISMRAKDVHSDPSRLARSVPRTSSLVIPTGASLLLR